MFKVNLKHAKRRTEREEQESENESLDSFHTEHMHTPIYKFIKHTVIQPVMNLHKTASCESETFLRTSLGAAQ